MTFDTMLFCLAAVALAVTCLAAIGTRSLVEFSRHELGEICRRRDANDRLGQILKQHDRAALAAETLQIMATAVLITVGGCWAWLKWGPLETAGGTLLLWMVPAGAAILLTIEMWIPRAICRLWAEPILYHSWPMWRSLATVLSPLVLGARFVDTLLHRLAGRLPEEPDEESFEDEIRTIVTEGHREGLLEEDAREMIEGVIELNDADVSEVMVPRTDMVSIPLSLSWQEVLDFVAKGSHTRVPVHQKNRDDIVGILYAKDLLPELAKQSDEPSTDWTTLLREPYFIPETKPVDALLQTFQRTRNHMAVVLDEYGGVSGLVTMEDVLEEIVGEIIDEYDKDLVDGIKELDDCTAEALGKVHVDEVNQRLALELSDDGDFDTIGGFIFTELGHVPVKGEQIVRNNVRLTVLEVTRRRIERVRLDILDRNKRERA